MSKGEKSRNKEMHFKEALDATSDSEEEHDASNEE